MPQIYRDCRTNDNNLLQTEINLHPIVTRPLQPFQSSWRKLNFVIAICQTSFRWPIWGQTKLGGIILFIIVLMTLTESVRSVKHSKVRFKTIVAPDLVRPLGEQALRSGTVLTPLYDAIELIAVNEGRSSTLEFEYYIGQNRTFFLTVTPCIGTLNRISFASTNAFYQTWQESRYHGLQLSKGSFTSRLLGPRGVRVDPFPGETNVPNYTVASDDSKIEHLERSRTHYTRLRLTSDSIHISLSGEPGDTYAVRLSTRQSPLHTRDGFPVLDKAADIAVCMVSNRNNTLRIRWRKASSIEMNLRYCVAVNSHENLPYRCSAMTRIDPTDYVFTRRPRVLRETDHLRPALITESAYNCTANNEIEMRIPPELSNTISRLGQDGRTKLYVNVYAINEHVDLSTAYGVHVINYSIPTCQKRRRLYTISFRRAPSTSFLLWNVDVSVEWPAKRIPNAQLYFQPCRLLARQNEEQYLIKFYQPVRLYNRIVEKQLCQRSVMDSNVIKLCAVRGNVQGEYILSVTSNFQFESGTPIGRLSLQNSAEYTRPKRPADRYYHRKLEKILRHSNSPPLMVEPNDFNQGNDMRDLHPRHVHPIKQELSPSQMYIFPPTQSRTIPVSQKYRFSKRKSRQFLIEEGVTIGVDCQGHQFHVSINIEPEGQFYWIHTIPIPDELIDKNEALLEKLNNMTDYCEMSYGDYNKLLKTTAKTMICSTRPGQRVLRFFTPVHHQNGYPRYYLLSIYIASPDDPNGHNKELMSQTLFDACEITWSSCYKMMPKNCMPSYPSSFPAESETPSDNGYRLIHNNDEEPAVCEIH